MNNEKEIKPSERIKELSNKWKNVNFGFDLSYVMAIVDFMDEQHVKKSEECSLSPSEALFGFCGWLTSRDKPITASSRHDAGEWACLVDEFCKANKLTPPRHNWTNYLTHPKPSPSSEPSECEDRLQCIYCAGTGTLGNKGCHYCKGTGFKPKQAVCEHECVLEGYCPKCNRTVKYKLPEAITKPSDNTKEPLVEGKEVEELAEWLFKIDYKFQSPRQISEYLIEKGYSKKENAKELVEFEDFTLATFLEILRKHERKGEFDFPSIHLVIKKRFGQPKQKVLSVERIEEIMTRYGTYQLSNFHYRDVAKAIHNALVKEE